MSERGRLDESTIEALSQMITLSSVIPSMRDAHPGET